MKVVLVHPYSKTIADSNSTQIKLMEIDLIDNVSCTALHLADCMDFVPLDQRNLLLQKAIDKLRNGGELTVSGTNVTSVVHDSYNGLITTEQFNASIFGGRLSASNLNSVLLALTNLGIKIVNYKLDGMYYAIVGRKNNG
jgi:hypothetical protein